MRDNILRSVTLTTGARNRLAGRAWPYLRVLALQISPGTFGQTKAGHDPIRIAFLKVLLDLDGAFSLTSLFAPRLVQ